MLRWVKKTLDPSVCGAPALAYVVAELVHVPDQPDGDDLPGVVGFEPEGPQGQKVSGF